MATSSSTTINALLPKNNNTSYHLKTLPGDAQCSFLRRTHFRGTSTTPPPKNMDLVVRATPETAGDLLSSIPTIPGLPLPGDNPWFAGAAALLVALPLMVQRLVSFTKEIDMAAQTVEKIADTVGKVAEEVEKAAEDMAEKLPEGGLKKVAMMVDELAEETIKDAQKIEDLMDKVEEIDDKLEEFLEKRFKGTDQS